MDITPSKPLRILVADDEPAVLQLYREIFFSQEDPAEDPLEREAIQKMKTDLFGKKKETKPSFSFHLVSCDQGDSAIAAVKRSLKEQKPFAVAFLDVRMPPGLDGIKVAEQIRALDPLVEIVIVTAYTDIHPRDISHRIPPQGKLLYLQKPFHPEEIIQFACALGSKWMMERELNRSRDQLERRFEERNKELIIANQALKDDIELRKQVEQDRLRLITAFEQVAEVIIITDAEGIIAHLNPAFETLTGYESREALGRSVASLLKPDQVVYDTLCKVVGRGEVWSGRIAIVDRKGQIHDVNATVSAVLNKKKTISDYTAVIRDITREIQMEKQIHQAHRMEAVGTMAGGIYRDLNSILATIVGYAEIANFVSDNPSAVKQNLDEVLKASFRARDLARRIFAFGKQRTENIRPLQLSRVLKEIVKLIELTFPPNIKIRQSIRAETGTVSAEQHQIDQVIMHLCNNAYHAMKKSGGTLEVGLERVELDPDNTILLPQMHSGPYLRINISDTGSGIPADILERIFNPYFTTRKKSQGTGLGLAVTEGIVKSHGGMITVSSQQGRGTTFFVYLPEIGYSKDIHEISKIDTMPIGEECILFVDDEYPLADIGRQMLENLGYEVIIRTSSIEALALFKAESSRFDMVVTDFHMPNMTGDKLAREMIAIRPDIPIVLSIGFGEGLSYEKAQKIGIKELAMKPLVMRDLAEIIRRVLEKR
jgi:two-component system cell cycle sensor histidine kinase/response regulator CckA